jgi:hypothetical protein
MTGDAVVALVGAPDDGAATLGWPCARYAPNEVRRHLGWMRMRVQGVLDPAHAPGVGWHEPGGLTSRELLDLVVALAPSVRGFALNELNPMTDHRAQSSILAANLVFQFAVAAAQRPG